MVDVLGVIPEMLAGTFRDRSGTNACSAARPAENDRKRCPRQRRKKDDTPDCTDRC